MSSAALEVIGCPVDPDQLAWVLSTQPITALHGKIISRDRQPCAKAADRAAHVASEVNQRQGRCSNMAQPSTGPGGSGRVAGPPDSRDEGDDGIRISCAAVLATTHENRGPIE